MSATITENLNMRQFEFRGLASRPSQQPVEMFEPCSGAARTAWFCMEQCARAIRLAPCRDFFYGQSISTGCQLVKTKSSGGPDMLITFPV